MLDRPDLQFAVLTPVSFKAGQFGVLDDFPGMSLGVWPHRPHEPRLRRARAAAIRSIRRSSQPNYLSSSVDQRTLVAGLEDGAQVPGHAPAQPFRGAERKCRWPAGRHADDEFLDFARRNGSTIYHFAGSNRNGARPRSHGGRATP